MKALIIGPFPPLRGGISDFNYELVNELEKSCLIDVVGFKINYPTFLRSKNKQIHKNNILKKSISYINPYNPFDWFRIKKLVKKNKYNFVISTYWTPITGICYYFINNFIGKNSKKIGLFHNLIPHEKFMFSELILKKFLKNLDKTVTLSKYNHHILEEKYNSKSLNLYHPINNVKTVSKEESLNFLKLDKKYETIGSGDKVRFFYVKKPNRYNIDSIAYKYEWPEEFDAFFKADYDKIYEKLIFAPIERFYNAVNWKCYLPNQAVQCDLFSLLSE